jgi:hypothetical protein
MKLYFSYFIIFIISIVKSYPQADSFILSKNDNVIILKAASPNSLKTLGLSQDNARTIDSAITLLNYTGTVIIESGTYKISSLNIPETIVIKMEPGAIFDIQEKSILTIQKNLVAGVYQIFTGRGKVVLSGINEVCPEWFGAKNDGITDCTTSIQNAVNSLSKGNIRMLSGDYKVTQPIILSGAKRLQGCYGGYEPSTVIFNCCPSGEPAIVIRAGEDSARGTGIYDLNVWSGNDNKSGIGILVYNTRFSEINNVGVRNFTQGYGIKICGDTIGHPCISGGRCYDANIQNSFSKLFLYNNKVNLWLTGMKGNNDGSSDEALFSDVNIQTEGLSNSIGIWLQRGMGNTFIRTSINERFQQELVTGIIVDDMGSNIVYSSRDNTFIGTVIEGAGTPIVLFPNTHGNRFEGLHILQPNMSTIVKDLSGGGNYVGSVSSGEGLMRGSSHFLPNYTNLLINPSFERWENFVTPSGWECSGSYIIFQEKVIKKTGNYSAGIVISDTARQTRYLAQGLTNNDYLKGQYVSFGAWIKFKGESKVQLSVYDGVFQGLSVLHPGDGQWHFLTTRYKINEKTNSIGCALQIEPGGTQDTIIIDGAIACRGYDVPMYSEAGIFDDKRLEMKIRWDSGPVQRDALITKDIEINGAEPGDPVMVGYDSIIPGIIINGSVIKTNIVTVTLLNKRDSNVSLPPGLLKIYVFK